MSHQEKMPSIESNENEQQKGLPPIIHDVVSGKHLMMNEIKVKEHELPASVEKVMSELNAWAKSELHMDDEAAEEFIGKMFVPDNASGTVTVPGNLTLAGMPITYFPSGVHVFQCADFSYTHLTEVPEIDVDLSLFLNNTEIRSFTGNEKFHVGKNLIVPPEIEKEAKLKLREKVGGVIVS
ncbi:MAG: hypothetical protein NTZ13_00785 [Candidatus Parcubacteria bacterium]|nr:hypothetical protein [Candidatus Parcubacteria bacterium]